MPARTVREIQEIEARPPGRHRPTIQYPASASERTHYGRKSPWNVLYRIGAIAALSVVVLVLIQVAVFILWPPPTTVIEYFDVFQSNPVLGLLDLDLLMIVDQLLIILVLLALYITLKDRHESIMLVSVVIGLIGAILFIVSREATFSMLALREQYAAATTEPQRAALMAAGQTLLTIYNGTVFSVGYFLSGLAMLLISLVMLRGTVFSRATGVAGVLAGVTGLVPASFGTVGLVLALVSLLPMLVWLALIGARLLELGLVARRRLTLENAADS